MSDETIACPECGSAHMVVRSGGMGTEQHRRGTERYRCSDCGSTTNTPVVRERQATNLSGQGMVGRLERADPDDVTAD